MKRGIDVHIVYHYRDIMKKGTDVHNYNFIIMKRGIDVHIVYHYRDI